MSLYHPKGYKLSIVESPTRTDIVWVQKMKMSKSSHQQMIDHHDSGLLSQLSEAHLAAFRERAMPLFNSQHQRAMPLFNSQHQNDRGIRWRGIAATAMVELLVLFALAFAVVRYVEWSSAVNQAEFMSATEPSSVANHSGEFSTLAQRPQGSI